MKNFRKLIVSIVLIALTSTMLSFATGASPLLFAGLLFLAGMLLGFAKHKFGFNTEMNTGLLYDGLVISDTTYAGEVASNFIVKAVTDNVMVQGGHVYVKDKIKKKFTIPRWDMDYEEMIQDTSATPVSRGTQTITGQTLTPAEYTIYFEFDPHDYEDHWYATQLNDKMLDTQLPISAESILVQEVLKRHGRYVNKAMWSSSVAGTFPYKYYDGFKTKATASSETLKTGSTTTLTIANIATEFQKGFTLIPAALKYDPTMKFFVSYATYELYMQYQITTQTYKGADITQSGSTKFRGLTVVPVPDLADNYYMIARGIADRTSNLWFGMNSMDDDNTVQLSKKQANSRLWFLKLEMKADVQIGWNAEVVTYE